METAALEYVLSGLMYHMMGEGALWASLAAAGGGAGSRTTSLPIS